MGNICRMLAGRQSHFHHEIFSPLFSIIANDSEWNALDKFQMQPISHHIHRQSKATNIESTLTENSH